MVVPTHAQVTGQIGRLDQLRLENERVGLQNQVRTTLLQALGGGFLVATALLTWRQIQVNREGQVTERFSRAIDHLGTDGKLDIRLGGIYALERIANDSLRDHGPVVEVLSAYIRGHSSRAQTLVGSEAIAPLRVRAADIQAALTVLGRRTVVHGDPLVLELSRLDFRKADLSSAQFYMADLTEADLSGALLQRANLHVANLRKARLVQADISEADLSQACLQDADLQEAKLARAGLEDADIQRANLRAANLIDSRLLRANLQGTNLGQANLQRAKLDGASLNGANLWKATLVDSSLRGTDLAGSTLLQADLSGAHADRNTVWPDAFDWRAAGAVMISE
jgi:uncharacterized protein YjbI with pentapeptide repeats